MTQQQEELNIADLARRFGQLESEVQRLNAELGRYKVENQKLRQKLGEIVFGNNGVPGSLQLSLDRVRRDVNEKLTANAKSDEVLRQYVDELAAVVKGDETRPGLVKQVEKAEIESLRFSGLANRLEGDSTPANPGVLNQIAALITLKTQSSSVFSTVRVLIGAGIFTLGGFFWIYITGEPGIGGNRSEITRLKEAQGEISDRVLVIETERRIEGNKEGRQEGT